MIGRYYIPSENRFGFQVNNLCLLSVSQNTPSNCTNKIKTQNLHFQHFYSILLNNSCLLYHYFIYEHRMVKLFSLHSLSLLSLYRSYLDAIGNSSFTKIINFLVRNRTRMKLSSLYHNIIPSPCMTINFINSLSLLFLITVTLVVSMFS